MRSFDDLPNWDSQPAECAAKIAGRRSVLKILLKTKDDPIFLERWILHHAEIVGLENIVIFDNMSVADGVLAIYQRYQADLLVVRFSGFQDNVHRVDLFAELYTAISHSSHYFVFLDTDEFLVLLDGDKHYRDGRLVEFLSAHPGSEIFPGTWLYNTDRVDSRFECGDKIDFLAGRFAWGKPILRSNAALTGFINHNIQLASSLFSQPYLCNYFVLHMANLLPEQRIAANVQKLISLRFAQAGESAADIVAQPTRGSDNPHVHQYLEEIKQLLLKEHAPEDLDRGPLRAGCMELRTDGTIAYYGESERNMINGLMSNPGAVYDEAVRLFSAR